MNRYIVYIISAGRSGSTLLDLSLGSHSKVFSLGEILRLNEQLTRRGPIKDIHGNILNAESPLCGCGNSTKNCEFWNRVAEKIKSQYQIDIFESPDHFNVGFEYEEDDFFLRYFDKFFRSIHPGFLKHNSAAQRSASNTIKLYDTIFKITNAYALVDSSKSIMRAFFLDYLLKDKYESFYIHLIRDCRGVMHSNKKKSFKVKLIDPTDKKTVVYEFPRRSADRSMKEVVNDWILHNFKAYFLLKVHRKKYAFVRYEDFTSKPENEVGNILKNIHLEYEIDQLDFTNKVNHIIGGNASRLNSDRIYSVQYNWQNLLSSDELNLYDKKAKIFAHIWGYK